MINCILQGCGLSIINWSIKLLSTLKMESFKSSPVLDCLIPSSPIAEIIIVKYGDRFSLKKFNYFNEETMRRLKTVLSQLTFPLMSRIAYSVSYNKYLGKNTLSDRIQSVNTLPLYVRQLYHMCQRSSLRLNLTSILCSALYGDAIDLHI